MVYQKGGSSGLTLALSRNGGVSWFDAITVQGHSRWQAAAVIAPSNDIYVAYSTSDDGAGQYRDVGLVTLHYRPATDDWVLVSDRLVHDSIGTTGATLATIEMDSAGRIWLAYRYYEGGVYSTVLRCSLDMGLTWQAPMEAEPPIATADKASGVLLRMSGNRLGLVYYLDRTFKFTWRRDSDPLTAWQPGQILYQITGSQGIQKGAYSAATDGSGRVYVLFRDKGLRVVSYDGTSWNTPGVVIEAASEAVYPSLSTSGTDVWAIWEMQTTKGVSTYIMGRQYRLSTGTWGTPTALSDASTVNTWVTSIHSQGSGPIAAWTRGTGPYVIGVKVVGQLP
jgi:hypothetical protein